MIKLSDFLSEDSIQNLYKINIGDVFLVNLTREEGITPKEGNTRNKFFIVLGFDDMGNAYGGVIINSHINSNMPVHIQELHMPLHNIKYKFLSHNSFIDCSKLFIVNKSKLKGELYKGSLTEEDLELAIGTVCESKTINKMLLRRFHISKNF